MPSFIQETFDKIKDLLVNLDSKIKIVIGSTIAVVVLALILVASFSVSQVETVLFTNLEIQDFSKITTKLSDLNYQYSTSGTETIFVGLESRDKILIILAQESLLPVGVSGWELFDEDKWSETQFEKDVKLQRAMLGNLIRALTTLNKIKSTNVNIAFSKIELFKDEQEPTTAAIILHLEQGVDKLTEREIRGVVNLVSRSIPGLKEEDISISDDTGTLLNIYDDIVTEKKWKLEEVRRKLRIQEKLRVKLLSDIRRAFENSYSEDRVDIVRLDLQLRWDEELIERDEVEPVVITPDNPRTPFSERVVKDSLEVSSKETTETFKGNGFTPEGPAGTEPNIPPGYKDKDYQKAEYTKKDIIKNNEFNRTHRTIKKQIWEIDRINLAVLLDGRWEQIGVDEEKIRYIREYQVVSDEEIRKVTQLLKSAIGFDIARGDQISIQHIQKDRSKQFFLEDSEFRKKRTIRRALIGFLCSIIVLILGILLFTVFKKTRERRRRLREEELATQQRMMHEAALRALEEQNVEVETSPEEKARKVMLENAIALATERPEDVAKLIRTWLSDEEEVSI